MKPGDLFDLRDALIPADLAAIGRLWFEYLTWGWIGRLPLMGVGVDLTVIGATVVAVFGTVTAWLAGGLVRRIVSTIAVAVVGFWWFTAMLVFPYDRGTCVPLCPPHGPDPIAVAYSAPAVAAQFLLLPAVIVGCVAIGVRRNRRDAGPGAPAA